MVTEFRSDEILRMVDYERGTVDRRIFHDADIYQRELEHIFARAWNFVAHDSQIPNPGDFFMTFIGEDRVIVVRDNDMQPQVMINSCRHRGNAVCRAEEGHTTSFMCTYHGWTYDLKGALVGVPGFKEVYHEELDRENWGLIKARTETYGGFIFANLDVEAPDLNEYLGEVGRLSIDYVNVRGKVIVAPGIQKWIIPSNWKFAVDNVWDYYHAPLTHSSALLGGWQNRTGIPEPKPVPPRSYKAEHLVVLGEYGHAMTGPVVPPTVMEPGMNMVLDNTWRQTEEVRRAVGTVGQRFYGHPHIFPNLWLMPNVMQASLRLPRGPMSTEIWWFTYYYEEMTPAEREQSVRRCVRHNGPAGMFEVDDGENWGESTHGTSAMAMRKAPLNYSMNVGRGEVIHNEIDPPHVECLTNEHGQLWHYRSWAEWMAADSWDDLRRIHTPPPDDRV